MTHISSGDAPINLEASKQCRVAEPMPPVQLQWYFMEPLSYRFFSKAFVSDISTMMNPIEIEVHFRAQGSLEVNSILDELHRFSAVLAATSPRLTGWLLKGNSKKEALLYNVFDATGPTSTAITVLNEKLKDAIDPRIVSMWNGHDDDGEGASIKFFGRVKPAISMLMLNAESSAFTQDWKAVARLVASAVSLWHSSSISIETSGYFEKKVFKNRPGVGWMLYLPTVLTVQKVPEARALLPVLGAGNKQIGTIIVSVIDAPFSDQNPEHVKVANAIEIRLADQDLLPRYADL